MIPIQITCRKPVYTINTVHTVTNNLKAALAQNDMISMEACFYHRIK